MPGLSFLAQVVARVRQRPILAAVVVVLFAGAFWFLFLRSTGPAYKTITVTRGDFTQSVSVSGTVKAAQDVDLGFEESGRVSAVYVSAGDTVPAGKILTTVDGGDADAAVAKAQAALQSEQAKLAGLQAGSRPQDIQVAQAQAAKAHQDLANFYANAPTTLADSYAKASDAVRTQLSLFFSNADSNSPQLNFSSSASQAAVDSQSKRLRVGQELSLWQNELNSITALSASSSLDAALASAQAHLNVVADFLSTVSTAGNGATTLPSGVSSIETLKADVTTAVSEVNTARANINTAASNISSQKILAQQLDAQLSLTLAGPTQQDIDAQAAQVAVAQASLESAQAQAGKTRIIAPFAGTITKADAKVGEIVSPDTSQISMISSGMFQVESYIPEVNIALVHVGDPAEVTLDAYGPDSVFDARLVSVDPGETVKDGVATYRAVLQFAQQDARIRSGMTANVVITTLQKSGVIAVPQGVVSDKNGTHYVSVEEGGALQEREVTTGAVSSLGTVEILSGLSEGDVVVLQTAQ
jgi:RND family efflux transporter MFP subunit